MVMTVNHTNLSTKLIGPTPRVIQSHATWKFNIASEIIYDKASFW